MLEHDSRTADRYAGLTMVAQISLSCSLAVLAGIVPLDLRPRDDRPAPCRWKLTSLRCFRHLQSTAEVKKARPSVRQRSFNFKSRALRLPTPPMMMQARWERSCVCIMAAGSPRANCELPTHCRRALRPRNRASSCVASRRRQDCVSRMRACMPAYHALSVEQRSSSCSTVIISMLGARCANTFRS
jgi:hypothetical protein